MSGRCGDLLIENSCVATHTDGNITNELPNWKLTVDNQQHTLLQHVMHVVMQYTLMNGFKYSAAQSLSTNDVFCVKPHTYTHANIVCVRLIMCNLRWAIQHIRVVRSALEMH